MKMERLPRRHAPSIPTTRPGARRPWDESSGPSATVVIPVNAQGDLGNVESILGDLSAYRGPHDIETILVVNNYPDTGPPPDVSPLQRLATRVLTIPDVRRPGEAVGFSARIPGIRAAASETVILFDADCRIPNPTALLNWYVEQLQQGAAAAYSHVGYYDYQDTPSVRFCFAVHHATRWVKRRLLRIPTTRGSNYAVRRTALLELYDDGLLADEMNVGPTMKRLKGPVVYGPGKDLKVLTSGRMFEPGWSWIGPYFLYRLRYNLRVLPVREGVAAVTGRENDPVRRYQDNRPMKL